MEQLNPGEIKKNIDLIKDERRLCYANFDYVSTPSVAFERCRISDVMLLPLYYGWEHICGKSLEEVCFEDYLKDAYMGFESNPASETMEMMLLLQMSYVPQLEGWKNKLNDLITIYDTIVNIILLNEKPT